MTRRGHLVLEAVVAGAVALTALTAVGTALAHASRDEALARDDVEARHLAAGALERLTSLPLGDPAWSAADAGTSNVPGRPGWTQAVAVSDVALGAAVYKRAVVTVGYRATRRVSLEVWRWVPPPP